MWELRVARRAGKSIGRAPRHERERLLVVLEEMRSRPFRGDVVPLRGQAASFRRRVGDWRIFFDVDREHAIIDVTDVARRTTTTYRKR